MRAIAGKYSLASGFCIALLAIAGCDKTTEPHPGDQQPETNSIAYLKSLCDGRQSVVVTREITVRGFITANDIFGEFHKSLVLEDASGGITVAADLESVAAVCPFGYIATLRCQGLVLTDYGGKIEIGTEPEGSGAGRIPEEEFDRYVSIEVPGEENRHRARTITLGELSEQYVDTRVRIDGVHFIQPGIPWCDTDPETGRILATERTIADEQGRTLIVRSAATCTYAKEPVPYGTGSLMGIIDSFNGKLSIRITNHEVLFPSPVNAGAPPTTCPSAGKYSFPTPKR